MGRLDNKVALIIGAAGRQGKVEAKLFAQKGSKVIATDLNDTLLARAREDVCDINRFPCF